MSSELSLLKINRFVLDKQRLTCGKQCRNIVETVRDIGGLHATSATTPYLSLFARVRDFKRESLDEELWTRRNLGKVRFVRTTVYILPKDMIPTAFAATRTIAEPASRAYSKFLGITEEQYKEESERIMEVLKDKKGMTVKLIKQALRTSMNVSPIVNLMCDQGLLIRGAPQKGWKSNLHMYNLFSECFPGMKLNKISEKVARKAVVSRYLASFGPVTENDVTWWTGFPKSQVKQIIEKLRNEIAYLDISFMNKTFLALSKQEEALKHIRTGNAHTISMLPSLDPYIMGYKDRERYLDSRYYDYVFDRSGNATSTILLDGRVIGIWDFEKAFVKILFFDEMKADISREIRNKAKMLGIFISGAEVRIKECDSMTPLKQRTAGAVMSPLRGC